MSRPNERLDSFPRQEASRRDEDVLEFGEWCKARRRALDLTQREVASQAYCALGTIRRIESDELRPSRELAERIADVLAVPRRDWRDFVAWARYAPGSHSLHLLEAPSPAERPAARSLPVPLNPILGRDHLIATAVALITDPEVRLLTFVGPPGVGKSRLALEVGRRVTERFVHGSVVVQLSLVDTIDSAEEAVVRAALAADVPARSLAQAADELRGLEMLVVLDNAEHLASLAAVVESLLGVARGTKVLATSRGPLHVAGEQELPVPPLSLPAVGASATEIAASAPVDLFVARSHAVNPGYAPDEDDLSAIAEICRRVDGLPLAIELAAHQTRAVSPRELLTRLHGVLRVLPVTRPEVPTRRRTLDGAIRWSYDQLSPDGQRALEALAIVNGSWSIEFAERLVGAYFAVQPGSARQNMDATEETRARVLAASAELAEQSLIWVSSSTGRRFRMLNVIREFALGRLQERGFADVLQHEHAAVIRDIARQAETGLQGPEQARWLRDIEEMLEDIRGALSWTLVDPGDPGLGFEIVGRLWWYWWAAGRLAEGERWLVELLARQPDRFDPSSAVRALVAASSLRFFGGRFQAALADIAAAEELAATLDDRSDLDLVLNYAQLNRASIRAMDDDVAVAERDMTDVVEAFRLAGEPGRWFLATAHDVRSIMRLMLGRLDHARADAEEALRLFEELGTPYGRAAARNYLADVLRLREDRTAAARLYRESLELMRVSGVQSDLGGLLHNLGYVAIWEGDLDGAEALFREELSRAEEHPLVSGQVEAFYGLAAVAVARGEAEDGARLVGAADRLSAGTEMTPWAIEQSERTATEAALRRALGDDRFVELRRQGQETA